MAKKKKSQAERAEKAARSKEMSNKNQASGKKTQKNCVLYTISKSFLPNKKREW